MPNIQVKRRWSIKRHRCQQCMKPVRHVIVRTTPRTTRYYCEGCAIERGIIKGKE